MRDRSRLKVGFVIENIFDFCCKRVCANYFAQSLFLKIGSRCISIHFQAILGGKQYHSGMIDYVRNRFCRISRGQKFKGVPNQKLIDLFELVELDISMEPLIFHTKSPILLSLDWLHRVDTETRRLGVL